MKVVDFLRPDCVLPHLAGATKSEVLTGLAAFFAAHHETLDAKALLRVMEEREAQVSTAFGNGFAFPHGKLDSINRLMGVLARSVPGLPFEALDGQPTHLLFALAVPIQSTQAHLEALARLAQLFRNLDFRQRLLDAPDAYAMFRIVEEEDARL